MTQPILVLDPGHGGRDPGAVGRRVREKDINLQVCLLLRDLLIRAGVRVIMTRDKDIWPSGAGTTGQDLAYRAKIANDANADLFVSWHYDSAEDPRAHGCAVWIHPTQKNKDAHHKASKLAYSISTCADQKNRGVYFGDFQVLQDTAMDALLVEGGFLTNSVEEARLTDIAFLRKQAEGAAQALCQILGVAYVQPHTQSPEDALDPIAVDTVISQLQAMTKTAAPDVLIACNFAANAGRRAVSKAVTQDLGVPDAASARKVADWFGKAWHTTDRPAVQEVYAHMAAALRAATGINQ